MNNKITNGPLFGACVLLGAVITFFLFKSALFEQGKTIAKFEAATKSKPVITVEGLGICQVTQGGKVYMLVDITNEMQSTEYVDEIGMAEKHDQLTGDYKEGEKEQKR